MKADCTLEVESKYKRRNFLWHVGDFCAHRGYEVWGVSQEAHMAVLDTAIRSLAERRRNLQGRLADLPMAARINAGVFQYDRILDEYAECAELAEKDALKLYDHLPLRASTLLVDCQTVYYVDNLTVTVAETLWQHGFRDIDVPDKDGRTPLMIYRNTWIEPGDLINEIEVCSWLIQKGAKLHRPQHSSSNSDSDRTLDPLELPRTTMALHYVAANIGWRAFFIEEGKQLLQNHLGQPSTDARLLLTTVFSDVSCDECVCACSSRGCLASTMMLKSSKLRKPRYVTRRQWFLRALEYLLHLMGPQGSCCEWLVMGLIRFYTFQELELRHTCCRWKWGDSITKLDFEEIVEIRDEDHEKVELLETLLQEFEKTRGDQNLISFLGGYWAARMDQVLDEQEGGVNEEALREIGVTMHASRRNRGF